MTIRGSLGPVCGSVITVGTVRVGVRVRVRVRVADCYIQTAGESDKMRINHVTETDQWPADPPRSAFCRVPCFTRRLFNTNKFAGSAVSAEVCALLSVILVFA